jgi:hypothetical protein
MQKAPEAGTIEVGTIEAGAIEAGAIEAGAIEAVLGEGIAEVTIPRQNAAVKLKENEIKIRVLSSYTNTWEI